MFRVTVKEIIRTPVLDYLQIVGIDSVGDAKVGDKITDGSSVYEITAIPLIRRNGSRSIGDVDICIPATNDNLIGKVLYAV